MRKILDWTGLTEANKYRKQNVHGKELMFTKKVSVELQPIWTQVTFLHKGVIRTQTCSSHKLALNSNNTIGNREPAEIASEKRRCRLRRSGEDRVSRTPFIPDHDELEFVPGVVIKHSLMCLYTFLTSISIKLR